MQPKSTPTLDPQFAAAATRVDDTARPVVLTGVNLTFGQVFDVVVLVFFAQLLLMGVIALAAGAFYAVVIR
jgi:hypothetical protein